MYTYFFIFFTILSPLFSLKVDKPKFCINCKHFISDSHTDKFGKCALFPKNINNYYLVDGITSEYIDHMYCSTARSENNMCDKEGKMYKKKITPRKKKM